MAYNKELDSSISNILIVDDVPANLKVLGDILRNEGHKVRLVPSGLLALKVAEKEKPDIILLDIMMPDMNGYEVCQLFKNEDILKDIPIIFISALNETDDVVKALNFGGVDFITKPFRAEEVIARVSTHLTIYKQKQELQKLNAMKDKLFSIIAHDLKSPFQGFIGLTEIMKDEASYFTPNELSDLGASMNKTATNLFALLKNLLEWAQMQQDSLSFEPKEIPLYEIITKKVETISQISEQKGITIINKIKEPFEAFVDENMINSALLNLLSNAVKFTKRDGSITVSAREIENEMIEISIKDTGVGMKQSTVDKLFLIGEKIGTKGTDGEQSTGLGLLLCKEFVEKHGGKIWAESLENVGSTFKFTLPCFRQNYIKKKSY